MIRSIIKKGGAIIINNSNKLILKQAIKTFTD